MGILITLLIFAIILVVALWVVDLLPTPPLTAQIKQIFKLVLVLFALIWLLQNFWLHAGGYYIH